MPRMFHHLVRVCGSFAAAPSRFLQTLKSLPDSVDAKTFARSFSAAETSKASTSANPLLEYFDSHASGPGIWKWRHYFPAYHRHLHRFVGSDAVVAEIGVFSGGSLLMWRNYFGPRVQIHGIDLDPATKSYEGEGIRIHVGDQENRAFWRSFREDVPKLDVMIDDGGHSPQQQRISLEEILPHLAPGGVYLCEDVTGDTNDFSAYVGGLITSLNAGVASNSSRATSFQRGVCSIHCYPFMVVIERADHAVDAFVSDRRGTEWQPPLVVREGYGQIPGRGA